VGSADTIGVARGAVGAALHPARVPARSVETIAMILNVFFIFFTFPFWFHHYHARIKSAYASIG
jgi:hypothetical protein